MLDSNTRAITMFRQTDFAKTIASAIAWQESGDYRKSAEEWNLVLQDNANYDMAYTGLGKAAYRNGEYEEAMELFQLGNNVDWYSRSYKEYRKTVVAKWFAPVASVVVILAVGLLVVLKIRKLQKKRRENEGRNTP